MITFRIYLLIKDQCAIWSGNPYLKIVPNMFRGKITEFHTVQASIDKEPGKRLAKYKKYLQMKHFWGEGGGFAGNTQQLRDIDEW